MNYIAQKLLTFYLIFSLCVSGFAQEKKDTINKKTRKVFIKAFYSPSFGYRISTISEAVLWKGGEVEIVRSYNTNQEIGKYSYNIGLATEIKFNKRLSLEIGITYNKLGYKTKTLDVMRESWWGGFTGPGEHSYFNEVSYNYYYNYISLPVSLNYYFIKRKLRFYAGIGISNQYLIDYHIVQYGAGYNGILDDFSSKNSLYKVEIDFFLISKIGCEYPINKRIMIFFEPHFDYDFNSIYLGNRSNRNYWKNKSKNEHYGNELHLYEIGGNIGIKF